VFVTVNGQLLNMALFGADAEAAARMVPASP